MESSSVRKIYLLVALLAVMCSFGHVASLCLKEERQCLLAFRDAHPTSHFMNSWDVSSDDDCCQWKGVHCDHHTSHVVELDLHNSFPDNPDWLLNWYPKSNGVMGSDVFGLKHLKYLDVSGNDFRGDFPAGEARYITEYDPIKLGLYLYLFGGVLPFVSGIFQLQELEYLDLSFNGFEGGIPKDVGLLRNLTHLNMRAAGFGGSIPSDIGGLSRLQFLDLAVSVRLPPSHFPHDIFEVGVENEPIASDFALTLGGYLKSRSLGWAQNMSALKYLALDGVDLSHVSSDSDRWAEPICGLRDLQHLHLYYCQLSGQIPMGLANLTSLSSLRLDGNPGISSVIPGWVGNLSNLQSLHLQECQMTGGFPVSLSRHPHLRELYVTGTNLSGNIDEILANGWPHLAGLRISSDQITGNLPSSIANISSLVYLSLNSKQIEGCIPSSIGNLSALQYLDLANSALSGNIPWSLGALSSLVSLDLFNNQLNGSIPTAIGHLSHLHTLCLSRNHLRGNVSILRNLTSLQHLFLSHNTFNGNITLSAIADGLRDLSLSHNQLTVCISPTWIPRTPLESLRLGSCNVGGIIPPFLSTQNTMKDLDLSNNNLVGNIPTWLLETPSLRYLNLSYNNLQGRLPFSSLPAPVNMWSLDLSHNQFLSGPIPPTIGIIFPSLQFLSISANGLSGGVPLSIGNMQRLLVLDASNNKLSGQIPESIANCSSLTILNLANNSLEGNIPSEIGMVSQLQSLRLHHNRLEGSIPPTLQNCTWLKIIDIGYNKISGKIPNWLPLFSQLRILVLRWNAFQGTIPSAIYLLKYLQILDLSHNNLTGTIPPNLGNLHEMTLPQIRNPMGENTGNYFYQEEIQVSTKGQELLYVKSIMLLMTCVDLSENQLIGDIPLEIGNLKGLHSLNISGNHLTGQIPVSFAKMEQLESLDLSNNQLYGKIPTEMVSLTFLEDFNVANNRLSGRIPEGTQFSTFNASSFAGNEDLCGLPLDKCEPPGVAPNIPILDEENEDEETDTIGDSWYLSLILGSAMGFSGVYGVLFANRIWRRRYFEVIDGAVSALLCRFILM